MRVLLVLFSFILIALFTTFCYLITTVHPKNINEITTPASSTIGEVKQEASTTKGDDDDLNIVTTKKAEEEEEQEEEEAGEIGNITELPVNLTTISELNATTGPVTEDKEIELVTDEKEKEQVIDEKEKEAVIDENEKSQVPVMRRSNFVVRFTDKNHKVVTQQMINLKTRIQVKTTTTISTIIVAPPSVKGFRRSADEEPKNNSKIVILKLLPNNTFIFEEDI